MATTYKSPCYDLLKRQFPKVADDLLQEIAEEYEYIPGFLKSSPTSQQIIEEMSKVKNSIVQRLLQRKATRLKSFRETINSLKLAHDIYVSQGSVDAVKAIERMVGGSAKRPVFQGNAGVMLNSDRLVGEHLSQLERQFNDPVGRLVKSGDQKTSQMVMDAQYKIQRGDPIADIKKQYPKEIVEFAEKMARFYEYILNSQRKVGMPTSRNKNFVAHNLYNRNLIAQSLDEATDDFVKELNIEETFKKGMTDVEIRKAVRESLDDYLTGKSNDPSNYDASIYESAPVGGRSSGVRNKFKSRRFVFKDGAANYRILEKWGQTGYGGNLYRMAQYAAIQAGKASAFYDFAGLDMKQMLVDLPGRMGRLIVNRARETGDVEKIKAAQKEADLLNRWSQRSGPIELYNVATGVVDPNPTNLVGKVLHTKSVFDFLAKFGMVAIRSMSDFATAGMHAWARNGDNLLGQTLRSAYNFSRLFVGMDRAEAIRLLRQGTEFELGLMATEWKMGLAKQGVLMTTKDVFSTVTGLKRQYSTMRLSGALMASGDAWKHATLSFDQLAKQNVTLHQALRGYGMRAAEWDVLRLLRSDQLGGVIDLDLLERIPGDEIRSIMKKHGIKGSVADLKSSTEKVFGLYLEDASRLAVNAPGVTSKLIVTGGRPQDTTLNVVRRLLFQYKTYGLAMMENASRAFSGDQGPSAKMWASLQYIASSMTIAYAADSLIQILQNKTPKDPNDPRTWVSMMAQSGGGGYFGDIIIRKFENPHQSVFDMALGPTLGELGDLIDASPQALKIITDDTLETDIKVQKLLTKTYRGVRRNVPFGNYPVAGAGMNVLFQKALQEHLDPGFFERQKRYLEGRGQAPIFEFGDDGVYTNDIFDFEGRREE